MHAAASIALWHAKSLGWGRPSTEAFTKACQGHDVGKGIAIVRQGLQALVSNLCCMKSYAYVKIVWQSACLQYTPSSSIRNSERSDTVGYDTVQMNACPVGGVGGHFEFNGRMND